MEQLKTIDDYLRYVKQLKVIQAKIDNTKQDVIEFVKKNANEDNYIEYKKHKLYLCEKDTYKYSSDIEQLVEECSKRKKEEEQARKAEIIRRTEYIKIYEKK